MILLIWTAALSFAGLAGMTLTQLVRLRQGKISSVDVSLSAILQPKVDHVAGHITVFTANGFKYLYLVSLLGIKKGLALLRLGIIKIEKRFATVIDSVRGRGPINHKKGAVSFFLKEVEQYRVEVRSAEEN